MTQSPSAIWTGAPNRSDTGARRWQAVVYAGIASLVAAAIFVAVGAVREVRELSRAGTSQSLWHVYQTHDAVQRVAAAAPEAALTQAGKDRFQTELELLASQVAAVREYRMLDLQLPQHAEAWKSIEQALADGLRACEEPGLLSRDQSRAQAERFGALRSTTRLLMAAAQQDLNTQRDLARARLIQHFWQGAAAIGLLVVGLCVLLWRTRASQVANAALADRLSDANRTLEARVEERTRDLESDRALLATILDASPTAVALIRESDAAPVYFNTRMREALALAATPTAPFPPARLFAQPEIADEMDALLRDGQPVQDREALIAGHPPFHALVTARRVSIDGQPASLIWFHDHSRHRQLELELQQQASTDALTGLANRRAFFSEGPRMLERARRYRHDCALLMIDIDHFKAVNDQFGHHAGDRVLRAMSDRLRDVLRQADLVARLGGEEFAALMPETDMTAALQAAERVREICAGLGPQLEGFGEIGVSVSIGVAQWRAGETLDHVLERADAALYRAKRAGRNRVESS
jgi:diguanylate cyclase (GGDEF)-like protein